MKIQVPFGNLSAGTRFQRRVLGKRRSWWTKVEASEPVYSHTKQQLIRINAESCGPVGQYTAREIDDEELVWVKEE